MSTKMDCDMMVIESLEQPFEVVASHKANIYLLLLCLSIVNNIVGLSMDILICRMKLGQEGCMERSHLVQS